MQKRYTLIIGAKPNRGHSADWLAGSIPAHWIHYEKSNRHGTAWFCPVRLRGVWHEDKRGRTSYESWRLLRINLLSDYGFLCDIEKREIGWRFLLKDILSIEDMNKKRSEYEKYIPWFRKEVYPPFGGDPDEYKTVLHLWFIFSKLEKLREPLSYSDFKVNSNAYDETKRSPNGNDFRGNTVFAAKSPQIVEKDIDEDFTIDKGIDEYLKKFFISKPPNKPMREGIVQDVFLTRLLKEGFTPRREVPVKRNEGRIDVLFEREGCLIAVEIKRDFDDSSVDQLKGYIEKCKEEFGDRKIEGWILCGRRTKALAQNPEGYKIIEYKVSLDFLKP